MLIALILRAGTDEELRAHVLYFFHLTLAVVVILQDQAIQLLSWVVADCLKGFIAVFLPPWKEKTHIENTDIYWIKFDLWPVFTALLAVMSPFQRSVLSWNKAMVAGLQVQIMQFSSRTVIKW